MSLRLVFRSVSVILAVVSAFIGLAQTTVQPISGTYILSQAICLAPAPLPPLPLKDGCTAQTIPGASIPLASFIEIQLPGGPSVWKASFVSTGVFKIGETEILDSPGRIAGTNKIYRFRYLLFTSVPGANTITLTESPPFVSKGTFTFTIINPGDR